MYTCSTYQMLVVVDVALYLHSTRMSQGQRAVVLPPPVGKTTNASLPVTNALIALVCFSKMTNMSLPVTNSLIALVLLLSHPAVLKSWHCFTNNCIDRCLWDIHVEPRYKTMSTTTSIRHVERVITAKERISVQVVCASCV